MTEERLAYLDAFKEPDVKPGARIAVGMQTFRVLNVEKLLGGWRINLERL